MPSECVAYIGSHSFGFRNRSASRIILLFLIACSGISGSYAQKYNYRVEQIPLENELNGFSGTCILQDNEGFMWFGSKDGLYRSDGIAYVKYPTNTKNSDGKSLSDDIINCMLEDAKGILWIGGHNLTRFDKKIQVFREFRDSIQDLIPSWNLIDCMVDDKKGNLWIGTRFRLLKFNKQSETFTHFPFITNSGIDQLMFDQDGTLWIEYDEDELCSYDVEADLFEVIPNTPCTLKALFEDSKQRFWITSYCGVYLFDKEKKTFTQYFFKPDDPNRLNNQMVRAILEDHSSNLWMRTFDGVYMFNKNLELKYHWKQPVEYRHFALHYSLTNALYEDNQGNIWFFTENEINRIIFKHKNFQAYDPLPDQQTWVRQLFEDRDKNIWFGMNYSLSKLDRINGRFERYMFHKEDSILLDELQDSYSLCIDSNQSFWMADHFNGLYKLIPQGDNIMHPIPVYEIPDSLQKETILSHPFADSRGRIWFSINFGEQFFYDQVQDKIYRLTEKPGSKIKLPIGASVLYEFDSTTLLAGGWSGMYKIILPLKETIEGAAIPSDIIEIKFKGDTNSIKMVTDMIVSKIKYPGTIWANSENGLVKISEEEMSDNHKVAYIGRLFTTSDGLPSNIVVSIQEDNQGDIWIGTSNGLSRLDPLTENITNYNIRNGLPSNRFFRNVKTAQGELFFGTDNGFISFFPDSINYNRFIPPIFLTEFSINNQPVVPNENTILNELITYTDSIELSYDQNNFSFGFASLNYTESVRNQFKYKLEGQNDDWVYTGSRNHAEFTNLKPGEYNFKVIGSNNDGLWNEKGTQLHITIHPPPWKTWWAFIIYVCLLLFLIRWYRNYLLAKAKLRTELEVEKIEKEKALELDHMKSRFFANISHEFRTPLMLLLGPIEDAVKKRSGPREFNMDILGAMHRNGRRLLQLINQLLDLSKLETGKVKLMVSEGNLEAFIKNILLSFDSLAESKQITFKYDLPKASVDCYFDRDKVQKILTNLLSNAFKFTSEGGRVMVTLQYEKSNESHGSQIAEMVVSDTGIGIPLEKLERIFGRFYQVNDSDTRTEEGTGIGLALTRELVELYRGEISVESKPGKGSTFRVKLPVSVEQFKEDEIGSGVSEEEVKKGLEKTGIEPEEQLVIEPTETDATRAMKDAPIILIVEDNVDLTNYISRSLGKNYGILTAENGKEGLERARENIPDLVISDVMMPLMNGLEMCSKLKKDDRTSHIPVVMLTARADRGSKLEGLETGADDYIIKPFDAEELKVRVRNMIDQRKKLIEKFRKELLSDSEEMDLSPGDQLLEKLISLVTRHMAEPEFRMDQLASELNMGRSQMYRKVAAITGYTPHDFILNLRLKKAAGLFLNGHRHVATVIHQVGFNSQSYFATCFKKLYGITPSEYIQSKGS
jgi:signal transduction histidine kinase/DNA-binding response OmpR family regulator/ligand-binding sensor domain-containing protein